MTVGARIRGFSLIEILVVVVIVAIVASIAVMSLGLAGDDRELQTESRRLVSLVEVARDEAMMQGREFGLEFMTGAYRFVEYDAFTGQWTELFDDDLLRLRHLPEGMELELFMDGQRVVLDPEPAEINDPESRENDLRRDPSEDYAPHVMIFSSGELTPFEIQVLRPDLDQVIALRTNLSGAVEYVTEDE